MLEHGASIVRDGLVLHLDAANPKSYPNNGSTLYDISGHGHNSALTNYQVETFPNYGIRLIDDIGRINVPTITSITTVELWFYQNVNSGSRYLLDMRGGGAGGWIYQDGVGSNWSNGSMYINGEFFQTITDSTVISMESKTFQQNAQVVVIASTPATDDINLFSSFSNNESMDVNFYSAKIYNRVLSAQEIRQNFEATRSRYGI